MHNSFESLRKLSTCDRANGLKRGGRCKAPSPSFSSIFCANVGVIIAVDCGVSDKIRTIAYGEGKECKELIVFCLSACKAMKEKFGHKENRSGRVKRWDSKTYMQKSHSFQTTILFVLCCFAPGLFRYKRYFWYES